MSSRRQGSASGEGGFAKAADRFRPYSSWLIVALIAAVSALLFFGAPGGGEGGGNATAGAVVAFPVVPAFGFAAACAGAAFLFFWTRAESGFRVSGLTLLFLPWAAFLFLRALGVFAGTPWRAGFELCMLAFPLIAFFASVHVARRTRMRWALIGIFALLAAAAGVGEFFALSGGGDESASALPAASGLAGTAGALVLLLAFFPMLFLAASPRFSMRVRLLGGYAALLLLAGIALTRDAGVCIGLVVGGVLAAQLLVRSLRTRLLYFVFLAVFAVLTFFWADTDVGCLRRVPAPTAAQAELAPELADVRRPLPRAAFAMFKSAPLFGVGTGRFAEEFEKYRPPQWQTDPRSSGSLFLDVLAEEGAVGLALFSAPLFVLLVAGVRACSRMPWFADTERAALRRKMGVLDLGALPEERIALAGTLCGLAAAGTLLALNRPDELAGVSVACGVFGGIAGFLLSAETGRRKLVSCTGTRRHLFLTGAFLVPAALLFACLPVFRAQEEFLKAQAALRLFFLDPKAGTAGEHTEDFSALERAGTHLRAALRRAPNHGDAWNALAVKALLDCRRDPENLADYAQKALAAAHRATACSDAVPRFFKTRALAEMTSGDFDAALADVRLADARMPFNAPELLLSVEILRAFPQGAAEAGEKLETASALLPSSVYVEKMRALILLDGGLREPSSSF